MLIIRATAKIIKLYLSEIFISTEEYPSAEDIRDFPNGLEFIAEFLQTFLTYCSQCTLSLPPKKGEKGSLGTNKLNA